MGQVSFLQLSAIQNMFDLPTLRRFNNQLGIEKFRRSTLENLNDYSENLKLVPRH